MFFLVRNLKTNLGFTPHDMDKLHSESAIVQMLRDKVEGLCFNEYGFVVKITKDQTAYSQEVQEEHVETFNNIKAEEDNQENASRNKGKKYYLISSPEVDENGIKVSVTFSAICFKAQKNDLIQFKVVSVCEDFIKGYIGPVQIKVPRSLIKGFQYKKDENIFISKSSGSENKIIKIDKGTRIKAKCISTSIEFNVNMKIVAEISDTLVEFIENDYK